MLNRMLQLLQIYRKHKCNSIIHYIMLNLLKKLHCISRFTAIQLIDKKDQPVPSLWDNAIYKTFDPVFYILLISELFKWILFIKSINDSR